MSCLLSTKQEVVTNIDSALIEKSHSENPMESIIDKKLSFEDHIKTLRGKVTSKPSAMSSVVRLMNHNKRKNANKVFKAQFNLFLLAWMLHNDKLMNKISRLHERCLRVSYTHYF